MSFNNMEKEVVLEKTIRTLLSKLVSPKYGSDVEYDIIFEKHDDTGQEYVVIDVTLDAGEYWKLLQSAGYVSPSDFDETIMEDVKNALKYLNITRSFVEIYVK